MREIRIYQEGEYYAGQEWHLSEEAGQHVGVVLRMQVGARLTLFNGKNSEFQSRIIAVKKKQVQVFIETQEEINRESPLNIHLGQALAKGDKMEWVVQKAVELGVHQITPLISERSVMKHDHERMAKKVQQWQHIAIAACEQCGRNTVPLIHMPVSFLDFISKVHSTNRWILHPQGSKSWRDYGRITQDITLLIGPEGGFTKDEYIEATRHDFVPLMLGPRILRTETAAITALSLLQAVSGDL